MLIRIILILAVVFALLYFFLRKKNIRIGLTPLGKSALMGIATQIIRLLLRRIGL